MSIRSQLRAIGCLLGFCILAISPGQADDRVAEALDIVNQLLERPERDETTKPAPGENPFAATPPVGTTSDRPESPSDPTQKPPEVRLETDRIEIEVGGRTIVVNRPSSNLSSTAGHIPPPGLRETQHPANKALATTEMLQAYALAVSDFQKGCFDSAVDRLREYEDQLDDHGLVAQTYALMLFQQGNWQKAAEWVYNGVANAKLIDWQTVSGIYGDHSAYAPRYHELQIASQQNPERVDLHFLIACHHLMLGHRRHALTALGSVQQTLDSDPVVMKLATLARAEPAEPPQPLE